MVTIISIIIVVALYMMLGIAVVAVAFMLSLFLAIGCALAKRKIAKVRPSERVCPMCGGQRIKFKYVSSGTTGTGRSTRVANVRFASGKRKFSVKTWLTAKIADTLLTSRHKKTSMKIIKSSITEKLGL